VQQRLGGKQQVPLQQEPEGHESTQVPPEQHAPFGQNGETQCPPLQQPFGQLSTHVFCPLLSVRQQLLVPQQTPPQHGDAATPQQ
jgi:hypothetical protein